MKININDYRVNFEFFKKHLEETKDVDLSVSIIACATHTPVIVLLHFAKEILGSSESIEKSIQSVIKFYGYREIII